MPPLKHEGHATPVQELIVAGHGTTDQQGRTVRGLYATLVASGETSKVFGVETRLSLSRQVSTSADVTRKVGSSY